MHKDVSYLGVPIKNSGTAKKQYFSFILVLDVCFIFLFIINNILLYIFSFSFIILSSFSYKSSKFILEL